MQHVLFFLFLSLFAFFSDFFFFAVVDTMELEEALNTTHRHLYLNIEEMEEVLNQRQNTEGTVQSEIASKITDGLTQKQKQ